VTGEAEKRRETVRLGHSGVVTHVAFDRDGRHLLTASADGYLRRWSVAPDPLFETLPTEWLNKVAIAPNGLSVATAGGNYSPGVWALGGDSAPRRLAPHQDDLSDASYSADGRWLATSDNRMTTIVFSTDAYTPVGRFTGRYSAVGRDDLVTSGNGRTLQRFRLPSGEPLEEVETLAEIQALAISSANQVAAVLDNGTVLLRNLAARTSSERARLAHERVRNVAYSPAGDRLATTGPDGTVRIWDAMGQLLKTFSAPDPLTAVAFDRSGTHVAAGGPTGEIAIWDVVSGEVVSRFAHPGKIAALGFAPAGPDVLFVGGDSGISSTPWRADDLRRAICPRLSRTVLTAEEWQRFVQVGTPVSACAVTR
jgi:WD40 repeat protein